MNNEIEYFVEFLLELVSHLDPSSSIHGKRDMLAHCLKHELKQKYKGHWYEEEPCRGQAYRCLRASSQDACDPLIQQVLYRCAPNCPLTNVVKCLSGFTFWIDPGEVSLRTEGARKNCMRTIARKTKNGLWVTYPVDLDELIHNANQLNQYHESECFVPAAAELSRDGSICSSTESLSSNASSISPPKRSHKKRPVVGYCGYVESYPHHYKKYMFQQRMISMLFDQQAAAIAAAAAIPNPTLDPALLAAIQQRSNGQKYTTDLMY